jgi:hypothetical protein
MANSIQAQIAELTRKIKGLANAVQTNPPGQTQHSYQHAMPNQHTPAFYQNTPQQYMPVQQYNQPPFTSHNQIGRGYWRTGRGRGRGYRGRNRSTYQNRNNAQRQQQWTGPPAFNQHMYQQPQMQGFYNKPTHTNPVKYHKNWNYCWSCGYDVANDHTSASCPYPKPWHVYHATRSNWLPEEHTKKPDVMGRGGSECHNN